MVGMKSDVGIVRTLNEDYAGYSEEAKYKLYVVADGMGGHNAGEVASKMAVEASSSNLKQLEEKLKQQAKKEAKLLAEINSVIAVLQNGALKIGAKTGTSDKIFGSVTSVQIARAIREQKGYEIDRRRITIIDEVKELGTFKAKIDFGNSNETEVEFEVVAE